MKKWVETLPSFDEVVADKTQFPKWLPIYIRDYYHERIFHFKDGKIPDGMRVIFPAFILKDPMEEVWEKLGQYGDAVVFGYIEQLITFETWTYNLAWNNTNRNMLSIQHRDKMVEHLSEAIKHINAAHARSIKMQRFLGDFRGITARCEVFVKETEKIKKLMDDVKNHNGGDVPLDSLHPSFRTNKQSFHQDAKSLLIAKHLKAYCRKNNISRYAKTISNTINSIYNVQHTPNSIHNLKIS